MTSIRSRILWALIGILFIGMTSIFYFSYQDANHEVEEIFDAQLAHSARVLQGLLPLDLNKATLQRLKASLDQALDYYEVSLLLHDVDGNEAAPTGHVYESKLVFQVWNQVGKRLVQSASAPFEALSPFEPGYSHTVLGSHRWRVFGLFNEKKGRWIFVAEQEVVRGELVKKIVFSLIFPMLVGLPLLALTIFLCVGKGLSPLTRLTGAIRKRNHRHLKPIDEDEVPDEIKPVVASLNNFMKELDKTLDREKRFTADAAHELRTPLAVLKVHAQNALNQTDTDDKSQSLNYLLQGIDRSTRVVDQLLNLARLEHDLTRMTMKQLDLKTLVAQVLRDITPLALQSRQELGFDLRGETFIIDGDEISLSLMTMNLVHNAIHYSPDGKSITVELEESPKHILLKIIDRGPGIPEELKKRIFDRFFRIAPGRTTGAGLGLSIVQRVIDAHNAEISLDQGPKGQGLCVSIVFFKAKKLRFAH